MNYPFFLDTPTKRRSYAMRIANAMTKRGFSFSFSQKKSWKVMRLIGLMFSQSVVAFEYTKKSDGTNRVAYGTRNENVIPYRGLPKNGFSNSTAPVGSVRYYDIEKRSIRAFLPENLLTY